MLFIFLTTEDNSGGTGKEPTKNRERRKKQNFISESFINKIIYVFLVQLNINIYFFILVLVELLELNVLVLNKKKLKPI